MQDPSNSPSKKRIIPISKNGEIVLPADILQELNITCGDQVILLEEENQIIIKKD